MTHAAPPVTRFWPKVDRRDTEECWLWTSTANNKGYGAFYINGQMRLAHRFAYELLIGPIPEGLELDHLCRTPLCVNPSHLEPVTHAENMRRGAEARGRQTHCKRGHDLSLAYVSKKGVRFCRLCRIVRGN